MSNTHAPIVFVHGLWLHAESWQAWMDFFSQQGYETMAVNWPGDGESTAATRANGDALAGYSISDIVEHIRQQIQDLQSKPILIGHSFGGLIVQNLLGRDNGSAAVAIDSVPIKGVTKLPFSVLKSTFPVLNNPFNVNKAIMLTEAQFRYGFANAVSEAEARELYNQYAMPGTARPIFQAATAAFNPSAQTKVKTDNAERGPLLLIAGEEDHTAPPILVKSTMQVYEKSSPAVTEFKSFEGRGHSLVIDSGWQEIAEYTLQWLHQHGL